MNLNSFYRAVIEDNNDPLKQGRVRIRVLGIHSPFRDKLSIDQLPWAEYATNLSFSYEGAGGISSIPRIGSWVWVFFDSGDITKPVYFAKIKSITAEKIVDDGFYDPNEIYPNKDYRNESEINRLARNETQTNKLNDNIIKNKTSISLTRGSYDTKVNITQNDTGSDKVVYPNDSVIETPSGHIIEIDDTKNNERIRIIHKSGSFIEINSNNDITFKSTNNEYNIIEGDLNSYVEKSIQQYVKLNIDRIIDGNVKEYIKGTVHEEIGTKKYTKVPQHTNECNKVIVGDVKITGTLFVNGDIASGSDIKTSSVGLNGHTHTGDSGGSTSTPTGDGGSSSAAGLNP